MIARGRRIGAFRGHFFAGVRLMDMVSLINAASIAAVFTASATLRFRLWKQPKTLVFYFLFFLLAESLLHQYFFPDIAMGIEVAYVCFPLAAVLSLVSIGLRRHEIKVGSD